jgi:hypothetical protein
MQKEILDDEKLNALSEMESDIVKLLQQIRSEKGKLEKKLQKESLS